MTPRFELFDHTADVGVRVWAPALPALVAPATEGLYTVIGHIATTGQPAPRTIEVAGDDPAVLLRDYLAEVLLLFEQAHRRLMHLEARAFTAHELVVTGAATPIDAAQSAFEREVKAVTYHELAIRRIADGWEATYILDI